MQSTPRKKQKELFQTSLNLPTKHLEMLEKLDSIDIETAEVKRRGAIKEIEREYKKHFTNAS